MRAVFSRVSAIVRNMSLECRTNPSVACSRAMFPYSSQPVKPITIVIAKRERQFAARKFTFMAAIFP